MRRIAFYLLTTGLGFLNACSSIDVKSVENPEILYTEGVKNIEKGRFIEALEYVGEIRRRFPQSKFAPLAELRTADIYFEQESFTEAAAAYGVFVELYPTHAEAPYAQYRRALSYLNDAPDVVARDQTPAAEALRAAEIATTRYASSPFAAQAKELVVKARVKLAEKEAYIARFYAKKGFDQASVGRWKALVGVYADLRSVEQMKNVFEEADRALAKASEASTKN